MSEECTGDEGTPPIQTTGCRLENVRSEAAQLFLVRSTMICMNVYFTTSLRPLEIEFTTLIFTMASALCSSLPLRRRDSFSISPVFRAVTLFPCYTLRYIEDSH